jgi:hypothetical protein
MCLHVFVSVSCGQILRQQSALEELKEELARQRAERGAETHHEEWLREKKHKLQALRVRKALAAEEKRFEEDMSALGVRPEQLQADEYRPLPGPLARPPPQQQQAAPAESPSDAAAGDDERSFEVIVDGVILPEGAPAAADSMRMVCGFFDAEDGQMIGRMSASEWQPTSAARLRSSYTATSAPAASSSQAQLTRMAEGSARTDDQTVLLPLMPSPLVRRVSPRAHCYTLCTRRTSV